MICSHHEICKSKLFIGPFFGKPDPHNGRSIFVYCIWIKIIIITIISNSYNSVDIYGDVGYNEGMYSQESAGVKFPDHGGIVLSFFHIPWLPVWHLSNNQDNRNEEALSMNAPSFIPR
jgi:hypothetical protein